MEELDLACYIPFNWVRYSDMKLSSFVVPVDKYVVLGRRTEGSTPRACYIIALGLLLYYLNFFIASGGLPGAPAGEASSFSFLQLYVKQFDLTQDASTGVEQ